MEPTPPARHHHPLRARLPDLGGGRAGVRAALRPARHRPADRRALGIDGEAVRMTPPLRFESRPGALRVRLPATASGLSPSAAAVGMSGRDLRRLVAIAAGR